MAGPVRWLLGRRGWPIVGGLADGCWAGQPTVAAGPTIPAAASLAAGGGPGRWLPGHRGWPTAADPVDGCWAGRPTDDGGVWLMAGVTGRRPAAAALLRR